MSSFINQWRLLLVNVVFYQSISCFMCQYLRSLVNVIFICQYRPLSIDVIFISRCRLYQSMSSFMYQCLRSLVNVFVFCQCCLLSVNIVFSPSMSSFILYMITACTWMVGCCSLGWCCPPRRWAGCTAGSRPPPASGRACPTTPRCAAGQSGPALCAPGRRSSRCDCPGYRGTTGNLASINQSFNHNSNYQSVHLTIFTMEDT